MRPTPVIGAAPTGGPMPLAVTGSAFGVAARREMGVTEPTERAAKEPPMLRFDAARETGPTTQRAITFVVVACLPRLDGVASTRTSARLFPETPSSAKGVPGSAIPSRWSRSAPTYIPLLPSLTTEVTRLVARRTKRP